MAGAVTHAFGCFNPAAGSLTPPVWQAVGTHFAGVVTPAYPAGLAAGNYMEAVIVADGADGTTAYSATGWTAGPSWLETGIVGGETATLGLYILWKVATGSESGNLTITQTGTAPGRNGAVIDRFTGVDTSGTPYESAVHTYNNSPGTSFTSAAITTSATGRLLINRYANQFGNTMTPGTGWTEAWDFQRTGLGIDYGFSTTYKNSSGVGVQSTETCTPSANNGVLNLAYALKGL